MCEPIDFETARLSVWVQSEDGEYRLIQSFPPDAADEAEEACRILAVIHDCMAVVTADGEEGQSVAVFTYDLEQTLCVGTHEVRQPAAEWRHPWFDDLAGDAPPRP